MSVRDSLIQLRARAERASELLTEEATKNALVMPMLRALGYDVFDPSIVVPEFTADFGTKKGEKVDYAIKINGEVAILFECKPAQTDLATIHASQLYRYFSVTKSRFGVLTNGKEWRFYTDLDSPNKMDEKPFFIFSIQDHNDQDIGELEKFSAGNFSVDGIISAASDLKLKSLLAEALRQEFAQPSDDFVRLIARKVHGGNLTAEVRARFATLILASIADILRDQANQRLKDAIDRPVSGITTTPPVATTQNGVHTPIIVDPAAQDTKTTEEELEAFRIIKAIARKEVDAQRVFIRDAASYCAVLLDNNNRKTIARLYLEGRKKRIGLFANKEENRQEIASIDDIYSFADQILTSIREHTSGKPG